MFGMGNYNKVTTQPANIRNWREANVVASDLILSEWEDGLAKLETVREVSVEGFTK